MNNLKFKPFLSKFKRDSVLQIPQYIVHLQLTFCTKSLWYITKCVHWGLRLYSGPAGQLEHGSQMGICQEKAGR